MAPKPFRSLRLNVRVAASVSVEKPGRGPECNSESTTATSIEAVKENIGRRRHMIVCTSLMDPKQLAVMPVSQPQAYSADSPVRVMPEIGEPSRRW